MRPSRVQTTVRRFFFRKRQNESWFPLIRSCFAPPPSSASEVFFPPRPSSTRLCRSSIAERSLRCSTLRFWINPPTRIFQIHIRSPPSGGPPLKPTFPFAEFRRIPCSTVTFCSPLPSWSEECFPPAGVLCCERA